MPIFSNPVSSLLTSLTKSTDGAVIGLALAYIAIQSFRKYSTNRTALRLINQTPETPISDLRSLLSFSDDGDGEGIEKMVFVRGVVEAKRAVEESRRTNFGRDVIIAPCSGERALVLERVQRSVNNRWAEIRVKDLMEWFAKSKIVSRWANGIVSTRRIVPFVLVDNDKGPFLEHLFVDLDGSKHPLPLTTVYHQIEPVQVSPSTLFLAITGHTYTIGILDEEKILSPGKEISAVGICSLKDGFLQIQSSKILPYFLSDMSKNEMVTELAYQTGVLFWSGLIVGSLSAFILGYAISRNWSKWKNWRQRRQNAATREAELNLESNEESDEGEVPEGQLCVICVMRRKNCVFAPCGHLVCCRKCALTVERGRDPKCPVCRQDIQSSVRIYDS